MPISRFWLAAVVMICALVSPSDADDKVRVTSKEIIQRIRARENRVNSAAIEWTQERFIAAKSVLVKNEVDGQVVRKFVPEHDETYASKHKFTFDRQRTRHWYSEYLVSDTVNGKTNETLRTYDGQRTQQMYWPKPPFTLPAIRLYPDDKQNLEFMLAENEPIIIGCYLTNPQWALPLDEGLTVEDADSDESTIDGVSCVVVTVRGRGGKDSKFRLWIDPARDFVIVRSCFQTLTSKQHQVDYSYRMGDEWGWVLSGWKIHVYGPEGQVKNSFTAKVTNRTTLNPPLTGAEFFIEVPADAYIDDLRQRRSYIQLADGPRRYLFDLSNSTITEETLMANLKKAGPESLFPGESEEWSAVFDGFVETLGDRFKYRWTVSHDGTYARQSAKNLEPFGPATRATLTPEETRQIYDSVAEIIAKPKSTSKYGGDGLTFTLALKGASSTVILHCADLNTEEDASPRFADIRKILDSKQLK